MKRMILVMAAVMTFLSINGCFMAALWVASSALSAKTAYNGYETLSSMKDVKNGSPAFKTYGTAFISADVQPLKDNPKVVNHTVETVYSRTINDMARRYGLDLVCKPYSQSALATSGDVLVIQVREDKPSFWGRVMSGEKIHASVRYIDKETAKVITEQKCDIAKNYEDLVRMMTMSAFLKISKSRNEHNPTWAETAGEFMNRSDVYPCMTTEEKTLLSKT